jgi:hypothetical protein
VYVENKLSIHSEKAPIYRTTAEQINNTSAQKTKLFLFNHFLGFAFLLRTLEVLKPDFLGM